MVEVETIAVDAWLLATDRSRCGRIRKIPVAAGAVIWIPEADG